jgi:DNA repair exonuclease SbcCD ATPase subunit
VLCGDDNIDITCMTTTDTDAMIAQHLVPYQEFIDSCIMLQKDSFDYVRSEPLPVKNTICNNIKMDIFTDILDAINKTKSYLQTANTKDIGKKKKTKTRGIQQEPTKSDLQTVNTKDIGKKEKKKLRGTQQEPINYKENMENAEKILKELEEKLNDTSLYTNNLKNELHNNKESLIKIESYIHELIKIKNQVKVYNELKKQIDTYDKKIKDHQNNHDNLSKLSDLTNDKINKLTNDKNIFTNIEQEKTNFENEKDKKIKELSEKIKKLNKDILPTKKSEDIKLLTNNQIILSNQMKEYTKNKNILTNKIKDIENKIVIIDDSHSIIKEYETFKKIEEDKNNLILKIKTVENEIKILLVKLEKLSNHEYDPNCQFCVKYNVTVDKINYTKDLQEKQKELDELNKKKKNFEIKIKKKVSIVEKYELFIYNQNNNKQYEIELKETNMEFNLLKKDIIICQSELDNKTKFVEDAKENEEKIKKNNLVNKKIDICETELDTVKNNKFLKYDKYVELLNTLNKLNEEKMKYEYETKNKKNELDTLKNKIMDEKIKLQNTGYCEEKIKEYEKHEKEFSQKKIKVEKDESDYNNKIKEIHMLEKQIIDAKVNFEIEKNKYQSIMDRLKEIEICDILITNLGTNGVISQVLKTSVLPKIEEVSNNILKVISNFTLKFKLVKTKGINNVGVDGIEIDKVKDNIVLSGKSMSGGETFLANLAIMLAMTHINTKMNSNCIFLDEAFIYIDSETVENIDKIFNYINEKYDTVLIISHDKEIIKQFTECITVKKENGYSRVYYK